MAVGHFDVLIIEICLLGYDLLDVIIGLYNGLVLNRRQVII